MRDFFVSYNQADRDWATWVSWRLDEVGFTTFVQAWDMPPGSNFVLEMQRATVDSERTIAILSPDYLASLFTAPEWAAAFAEDPTGSGKKLLPVRIRPCEPPGLLKSLVYCDLVGLDEDSAAQRLVSAVRRDRMKPERSPSFPGVGTVVPPRDAPAEVAAARELLDILKTTYTTFVAQNRLRNELAAKMIDRLGISERLEYERFFQRYFSEMNPEEQRIHATIRAYTGDVMREYNRRALDLAERNPGLEAHVELLGRLKDHLRLWHAKFDRLFEASPDVCLVYVGVEEKVPFPSRVESQLEEYLRSTAGG